MKPVVACAALLLAAATGTVASGADAPAWPEITQTAKPWTRWWWPASAVDPAGLDSQLAAFATAGLGGVEITPIYGARGYEDRYLDFLSPRWVGMLDHTTRSAARLGLGVDMATGTGWPFGGPGVTPADAASSITLAAGELRGRPTGMMVKRAAPGGAGLVLDPYSSTALGRYLARFTQTLERIPRSAVRAQFHDSFEYFDASWTAELPAAFRAQHGYDIQDYARELMGVRALDADTLGRVKGDYRRTLGALHLEYVGAWIAWARERGSIARNQAHGAPGNLLDLYAAPDIPETESFGSTPLPIAGLRTDPAGTRDDPDPPLNLIGRFASSAAHVTGRPLVSSETLTWLRENFRESPSAAKPQLDRLFVAGINHVFYHGVTYSPPDAPWPGWFFYAATQLGTNNPLWRDFAAMNAYVARVQSVLQAGAPDNDILLYWPFDDLADDPSGVMRQYGMHENDWLIDSALGRLAQRLLADGYSFDLISDAQLATLRVAEGALVAPGGTYRVIVVPRARRMAPATLEKLRQLQRAGARVVFEALPADVPGLGALDARRAQLRELRADAGLRGAVAADVSARLASLAVPAEPAARAGLAYVRRARADGHDYFFANQGPEAFDGWLALGTPATAALLLDPLTGRSGAAATRGTSRSEVYLQLASGESVLLRTSRVAPQRRGAPAWRYVAPSSPGVDIGGPWRVEFIAGGPTLPAAVTLDELVSWTQLPGAGMQQFSGTARYRVEFDAPSRAADEWLLDLGDVRESARVRLNGRDVATAWSLPFRVRIGALKARGNVLEIEVTNLPANRIRDLDVRKVDWKIMRDINLASLRYRALDASGWDAAPSGLTTPVRLVPLAVIEPRRRASVDERGTVAEHAAVHDGEDSGVTRFRGGGLVDHAILQPQRRHLQPDAFIDDRGHVFGPAEHIDHIDGPRARKRRGEVGPCAFAEEFGGGGVYRDDAVAELLQRPPHIVTGPAWCVGQAEDGDRVNAAQEGCDLRDGWILEHGPFRSLC